MCLSERERERPPYPGQQLCIRPPEKDSQRRESQAMSAAQMPPAPGPDENHLTNQPDFSPASYQMFPSDKTATLHHALSQEKVCAMG